MSYQLFTNPDSIADDVYDLRVMLQVSQAGLGQKLGVSNLSVHRWEAGKTRPHKTFVNKMKRIHQEAMRKA